MAEKAHTVILQINAAPDGFNLDDLLDHVEALEGVRTAQDIALFTSEAQERTETVTVTVPAVTGRNG
jgi:hypothetical protein